MNSLFPALLVLFAAASAAACRPTPEDKVSSDPEPGALGARDRVIPVAAPLCSESARRHVTTAATKWWSSKVEPTGRGQGPYAYVGAAPSTPPSIGELVATLASEGIALAPDPMAHHWQVTEGRARLSLEGVAEGEPGYIATFEFLAEGDALRIERLTFLRGQGRWTCGPDGSLVSTD